MYIYITIEEIQNFKQLKYLYNLIIKVILYFINSFLNTSELSNK